MSYTGNTLLLAKEENISLIYLMKTLNLIDCFGDNYIHFLDITIHKKSFLWIGYNCPKATEPL